MPCPPAAALTLQVPLVFFVLSLLNSFKCASQTICVQSSSASAKGGAAASLPSGQGYSMTTQPSRLGVAGESVYLPLGHLRQPAVSLLKPSMVGSWP